MKIKRLHDKLYLKSNRYKKPKESSKMLLRILKQKKNLKKKQIKILDIGCANGELIYFLKENLDQNIKFYGFDIRQDLINKSKKMLPDVYFKKIDISKKIKFKEKFDIIICAGVICIFDKLDDFFHNIKKLSKDNTIVYIFDKLNQYDYNVFNKYEDFNLREKVLQSGWNIWSINYLKKFLKNRKVVAHKFDIKIDIKKRDHDLMRAWTIKVNKKRYFTNGLKLLNNQYWLEFR